MERTELTVSMEPERLDMLRYFLTTKNKRTSQVEFQRALGELYETYVLTETRAYLGTKCHPNRPRPGRVIAKTAQQRSAGLPDDSGSTQ